MLFGKEVAYDIVFNGNKEKVEFFQSKAIKYLQRGIDTQEQKMRKADMDLNKDIRYIATSIETQYHLDIREKDIHFWHFIDLIEGLTNTLLNHIRDIRNADLNDYNKDFKKKKALIDLKNHYALNKNQLIEKPKSLKELYEEVEASKEV